MTLAWPSQPRLSLLLFMGVLRLEKFSRIDFPSPAEKKRLKFLFLFFF